MIKNSGDGVFIAGMLHILHNIVAELVHVMNHFAQYCQDLTLLTTWLRKPHMRQRFLNTCLIGEFAELQDWLQHFSLKVNTHRWGVVLDGTCEILQLEQVLRTGFQLEHYGGTLHPEDGADSVKIGRGHWQ